MKKLVILISLLTLVGCASMQPTIIIKANGDSEIRGFQVVSLKGENKTFVYKPWYQVGFLDTIIKALASIFVNPNNLSSKDPDVVTQENIAKQKYGFPYDVGR